jgi:prepilin-type N-terminal cleavage/methylation domain-containing protein
MTIPRVVQVSARRAGFTMSELALTIVLLSLLTLIATPRVGALIHRGRVNRTTAVVAADLESAFAIAARQRKPVRLTCACDSTRYRVIDRAGGIVRLTRMLSGDTDLGISGLVFSTNPVDIFPSGVASSPLTVTISGGGHTRQISMTTAGQVRILP